MAITSSGSATQLSVRPYAAEDEPAVLALVNADRLPGQPEANVDMLAEALAGRSPVDGGWWAELDPPATDVVHDGAGEVLGVVSYAHRSSDGAGLILWLHCFEDEETLAKALIARALDRLGPRTVYAFEFASALTHGLEGLPSRHRPATRRALEAAGFTDRDLWRYMHAPLPIAGLPHADGYTVTEIEDPPGKRLEVRDAGEVIAEATIGRPVAGAGVLWWISVVPAARGRGTGPALLGSALDLLTGLGADEVILYVDDDAPPGDSERDRTAANRMYDRAGLREVDRLFSFTRRP
ncbi:GNAT family N-acetyltransferase [Streptomyces sp. NPDC047042]|uniref:GNAT family N-acetyltransferase n=1 Tax=Streptomyces sp. NPDC047042 TaxID=3154807 RepID=UPI0033D5CCE7